eukprot:CAMPEP_0174250042 /NCGR_PEP_ID=MMETSP0439-20130205/341_1 /TAXON_ID=0 /ORGANISM="Stereomyxa ramosa, Strain Chinc5" /LENGTH=419 /DNA_ID=CAMNT_0015330013 /DNA_START=269 /DNA_END=1528 /DNA_ORIENTATION=-
MEKGNLSQWQKKEGDKVDVGDIIADVETDKATMEWESTDEGYVARILVPEGAKEVPCGKPVIVLVSEEEDIPKFADYQPEGEDTQPAPEAAPEETKETEEPEPEAAPAPEPAKKEQPKSSAPTGKEAPTGRIFASPLARKTAADASVPLDQVTGTGPGDRIIKADVVEFQAAAPKKQTSKAQVSSTASYTDHPNSNIRKVTAERLTMSKQTVPHYYLTTECNVDRLLKVRESLNKQGEGKYKLSVNDFVIKAAALALKQMPAVNSSWGPEAIRTFHNIDINVAVNTDHGLFTPIVFDADKRGLAEIANSVRDLAAKAKENKLQPQEFMGGTFTISNLGMFGIKHFTAVINPPQSCILAVGGTEKRVVVNTDPNKKNPFTTASIMAVTLSCDHRVVDGAVGAQWLQHFRGYMEDPLKLLL